MNLTKTDRYERRRTELAERKMLQQRNFVSCFAKTGFNIARTCRIIGITRSTYNNWLRNDERFTAMVEASKEERTDLAESILLANMQDNNKFVSNAATIFYLKTKGSRRGYNERKELDVNIKQQRSKEEIDAIVRASQAADSFVEAEILGAQQIPEQTSESDEES